MKDYIGCIVSLITLFLFIIIPLWIGGVLFGDESIMTWQWIMIVIGLIVVSVYWLVYAHKENNKRYNEIQEKKKEIEDLKAIVQDKENEIKKNNLLINILRSKTPFLDASTLYAESYNVVFDCDIKLMIRKNNRFNTIDRMREIQTAFKENLIKYKRIKYIYIALVNTFFKEYKDKLQIDDDSIPEQQIVDFLSSTPIGKYIKNLEDITQQQRDYAANCLRKVTTTQNECNQKIKTQQDKSSALEQILYSQVPFKDSAELIAKLDGLNYNAAAYFLRYKSPPAPATADKIEKEFKQEYVKWRTLYEELYAKYQFLCETFPDLRLYIDDEKSLLKLAELNSFDDFQDETDRVANYLSKEEWMRLTPTQRNQLALDRYIQRDKDNLTIGLEYEMYAEYVLRTKGFKTIPHGILNGLNDLGRDIIAWKDDKFEPLFSDAYDIFSDTYVYIIQCKLRSQETVIHENVICQVYGSAIEYELEHPERQAIPTICTNVPLSETAQKFAERLKVFVLTMQMGEFPRIKCNVNNGEKIYHLPFDQQYWRTQIKNNQEFYAWTVEEAERKGFRRAMRHNPYSND